MSGIFSRKQKVHLLVLLLVLGTIGPDTQAQTTSNVDPGLQPRGVQTPTRVREPAVAGMFYPKDAKELSRTIDGLLSSTPAQNVTNLKALVCPHAGYEFSGKPAAFSYKTLAGHQFETVVILAPSHDARFQGASVPVVDAYRTPLGLVPISPKAKTLAKRFHLYSSWILIFRKDTSALFPP